MNRTQNPANFVNFYAYHYGGLRRIIWNPAVDVSVCVCVWNFSREVKLVPALPWQYFGNI